MGKTEKNDLSQEITQYARSALYGGHVFFRSPINDLLRGVLEEAGELAKACRTGDYDSIFEEIGDLLFMTHTVALSYDLDPERALLESTRKIIASVLKSDHDEGDK